MPAYDLALSNNQALIRVLSDGQLEGQAIASGHSAGPIDIRQGVVAVKGIAPVTDVFHYALPCLFERLEVHVEGVPTPAIEQSVGTWPASVVEDDLEMYPCLHFLQERKTGMPWRYERWYTLAEHYLVIDSEQYLERSCPRQRGKDWERLIIHLRQVVDVIAWAQGLTHGMTPLVSAQRIEKAPESHTTAGSLSGAGGGT